MSLQWAGIVLAVATFAAIGLGHVLVRRLHARYGTRASSSFFALGVLGLAASLIASSSLVSGVLGITAITLAWDGLEIFRQEKRVKREASRENDPPG